MRTKNLVPSMLNSQKLRVILNGVILFCTVKEAHFNIFGSSIQRDAVVAALMSLSKMREAAAADLRPIGLAGSWIGCDVQVDLI